MKLCKISGLSVKLKNDKSKFLPIMAVKLEEKVLKCVKSEVQSPRQNISSVLCFSATVEKFLLTY